LTILECHGHTNGQTEYRPLHSCLNAESSFTNIMHLRDSGCAYAPYTPCLSKPQDHFRALDRRPNPDNC